MGRKVAAWIALLTLLGCGKRGTPLPPEPRGPREPEQVSARQLGEGITVTFTSPQPRGAKPSQVPVRAELVRVGYEPGRAANLEPSAFARRAEIVGRLNLPPDRVGGRLTLIDGSLNGGASNFRGWTLRYAVRVRDARGRRSPLVLAEDLLPVGIPPPPMELTARAVADGIRLRWQRSEGRQYHVYRAEREADSWPELPLNTGALDGEEYLDRNVQIGKVYRYVVRATLDGDRPFRESGDSSPIQVLARDLFPPSAPTGLVAVQEDVAVRLFWNPNEERDLAGYRVFRRRDGGPWRSAGSDPMQRALYLDTEVAVGERLEYRVSAVDGADPPNESPFSESVEVEIRDQLDPLGEPRR